ncbi:MAG: SMC-Scp complex subunit ScpB [Acidobacteriota bacterium]
MSTQEIKPLIEALIYVTSEPLSLRDLQKVLDEFPPEEVAAALEELRSEYENGNRGLTVGQVAGGFQLMTAPATDPWIRKMLRSKTQDRLSRAALETLAIIAYKQPVTLPEILDLRRVNSTGVIKTLLDKNLIRIVGRKKVVGNPILYGTTKDFLQRFGLNDLEELPSLEEFQTLLEGVEEAQGGPEVFESEPAGRPARPPGDGTERSETGEEAVESEPSGRSLEPPREEIEDPVEADEEVEVG